MAQTRKFFRSEDNQTRHIHRVADLEGTTSGGAFLELVQYQLEMLAVNQTPTNDVLSFVKLYNKDAPVISGSGNDLPEMKLPVSSSHVTSGDSGELLCYFVGGLQSVFTSGMHAVGTGISDSSAAQSDSTNVLDLEAVTFPDQAALAAAASFTTQTVAATTIETWIDQVGSSQKLYKALRLDATPQQLGGNTHQVIRSIRVNNQRNTGQKVFLKLWDTTVGSVVVGTTVALAYLPVPAGRVVEMIFPRSWDGIFKNFLTVACVTGKETASMVPPPNQVDVEIAIDAGA